MKHKIKMIGFDLDGTLLTTDKKLTERTKNALHHAAARGVTILPVTGRPLSGLPKEITQFPGIQYAVTSNGARIVDLNKETTLYEAFLDRKTAKIILNVLGEYDTLREIYYEGQGYAETSKIENVARYVESPAMRSYIRTTRKQVDSIEEKFDKENRDPDKIQGIFADKQEKAEAWKRLESLTDAEVTGALNNNIEIMGKGVTKGKAIAFMAEKLGISLEEIMTFGDGANDISMIEAVGTGVAMANGIEEIHAAADLIAESNDEDGVAKIIEKYILG